MTLKKNFDQDRDHLKIKKQKPEKNRESSRVRLALRHGDLSVLEADELDDLDSEWEPE